MALGASELIQEVSEGKITGEEDRYSKTDLWDFAANVEGAEKIIELLTPALGAADPELLADIEAGSPNSTQASTSCARATASCCSARRTTTIRRRTCARGSP